MLSGDADGASQSKYHFWHSTTLDKDAQQRALLVFPLNIFFRVQIYIKGPSVKFIFPALWSWLMFIFGLKVFVGGYWVKAE